MKLFDKIALLQALFVGGFGLLMTLFYIGFEQFEIKDYLFPTGIMIYIYIRNADFKGENEKDVSTAGDGEYFLEEEQRTTEAPPLDKLVVISGNKVELGKDMVLILAWATWCGHSKKAMIPWNRIVELYAHRGVKVVAITRQSPDEVQEFLLKLPRKLKYTIASDSTDVLDRLQRAFGLRRLPHAFLADGRGQVAWHGHPAHAGNALSEILDGESEDGDER